MTNRPDRANASDTHASDKRDDQSSGDAAETEPQNPDDSAHDDAGEPPVEADGRTARDEPATAQEATANTGSAGTAQDTTAEPREPDGDAPGDDETAQGGTAKDAPNGDKAGRTDRTAEKSGAPRKKPMFSEPLVDRPLSDYSADGEPSERFPGTGAEDADDKIAQIPPGLEDMPAKPETGQHREGGRGDDVWRRRSKRASPQTVASYRQRAEQLITSYRTVYRLADDDELPHEDFVNWLLGVGVELKQSGWRSYRNAIITYLEALPSDEFDVEKALALLRLDEQIQKAGRGAGSTAKRAGATSSLKLPYDVHQRIRAYLTHASSSSYAPILLDLIDATLSTGLRWPEWATSQVIDSDVETDAILRVRYDNVTIRTLDLSPLDADTKAAVRRTAERSKAWRDAGAFEKRYESLRRQLETATKKAVPKLANSVSLYAYRHQFIANAKATMSLEEVAAVIGLAEVMTSKTKYGQRHSAWSLDRRPPMARAVDSELQRIHRRIEGRDYQRYRKSFQTRR